MQMANFVNGLWGHVHFPAKTDHQKSKLANEQDLLCLIDVECKVTSKLAKKQNGFMFAKIYAHNLWPI